MDHVRSFIQGDCNIGAADAHGDAHGIIDEHLADPIWTRRGGRPNTNGVSLRQKRRAARDPVRRPGWKGPNGDKKSETPLRCPKVFHSFPCQIRCELVRSLDVA